MPDPLMSNDDLSSVEPRSTVSVESRAEETVAYQAPLEDPIRKGEISPDRQLPEEGTPRLNRTAQQIGGTIGRVVSQARKAPDSARQGLHLVRNRAQQMKGQAAEQISSSASSLADSAEQRIREIGDAARAVTERAQQRAAEWMDLAEERGRVLLDKADDVAQFVAERTSGLKQELDSRTRELRENTRMRLYEARLRARYTIREHPLETLGCIAGAAFILGVSLRIVRSRNASRY